MQMKLNQWFELLSVDESVADVLREFLPLIETHIDRILDVLYTRLRACSASAPAFRSDEALYGRYWGCAGQYHSLHFELCFYQGIAYCLREGLGRFEPGAGGEHKIARGFAPTIVHSAHWIADPAMHGLIARHLDQQGDAVRAYRDDAAEHLPFRTDAGEKTAR